MDFTLSAYKQLLHAALARGYVFQTFEAFLSEPAQRAIILRHDVDRFPQRSLLMARLENELGISGTYYFRCVNSSWDDLVVEKIVSLGHEIGYHYEDLAIARGNHEAAIAHFEKQLTFMRKFYPVKTICMHGSPLSRHDNRDLWKKYDYRLFGIAGEPYLDLDFSRVFYLTDTGRRWDGHSVSIRDKITARQMPENSVWQGIVFRQTTDITAAFNNSRFPAEQVMFTLHPQRWTNSVIPWAMEITSQGLKNQIKRLLVKIRK